MSVCSSNSMKKKNQLSSKPVINSNSDKLKTQLVSLPTTFNSLPFFSSLRVIDNSIYYLSDSLFWVRMSSKVQTVIYSISSRNVAESHRLIQKSGIIHSTNVQFGYNFQLYITILSFHLHRPSFDYFVWYLPKVIPLPIAFGSHSAHMPSLWLACISAF